MHKIQGRIDRAKDLFHSYKVELRDLPKELSRPYEMKSKQHSSGITKLMNDLNWAKVGLCVRSV